MGAGLWAVRLVLYYRKSHGYLIIADSMAYPFGRQFFPTLYGRVCWIAVNRLRGGLYTIPVFACSEIISFTLFNVSLKLFKLASKTTAIIILTGSSYCLVVGLS